MATRPSSKYSSFTSEIRFPCPVIQIQGKKLKKKCCKKYKKGKRCKRCPKQ